MRTKTWKLCFLEWEVLLQGTLLVPINANPNRLAEQLLLSSQTHFKQLFKTKGNYSEGFGEEDAKKNWAPQSRPVVRTSPQDLPCLLQAGSIATTSQQSLNRAYQN